jgi:signal transduction histidine kinase
VGYWTDQTDEANAPPARERRVSPRAFLGRYALVAGILAVVLALLLLTDGWFFLGRRHISMWHSLVASAAAASVLSGASLLLLANPDRARHWASLGRVLAGIVLLWATLTLAEFAFGIDLYPGQSAPQTAAAFLALSGALLCLDQPKRGAVRPAEVFGVIAMAFPVIALLGYLFGIEELYGLPAALPRTVMAIQTAVVLLLLASGTLAARPNVGHMAVLAAEDMGGSAARQLLWSLLLLPPVAIVAVLGARLGFYPTSFAFAFLVFFSLVDGIAVILLTGSRLSRLEERMQNARAAVAEAHQREALQRSRLQAVFDAMPEAVLITDAHGDIVQQNAAAKKFARETAGVDPWGNALRFDLRAPAGDPLPVEEMPIYRALRRGETVVGAELAIVPPDGKLVPIIASATPLVSDHGSEGAIVLYQDIRSIKELERLREEWAAIVAHDLRQPVSVITLTGELLVKLHEGELSERERQGIDRIRSAATRLGRMINDLLDASRIEAKRLSMGLRTVDIRELIDRVAENLTESTAAYGVEVCSEPDLFACVDSDRIQQVLENLLTNACKYGQPGTPIRISATSRDDVIEVTVENQGPGITAEQLPKLFSRFARTKEARASRESGLGLGLYISKGLIEAHGGQMWAESTPGQTTCFHFTVPRGPRPGADREPDEGQRSALAAHGS